MTRQTNAEKSIQATLNDHHGKTMKVINAIKDNTKVLLSRADALVDQLARDERGEGKADQPAKDDNDIDRKPVFFEPIEKVSVAGGDAETGNPDTEAGSFDKAQLVSEVSKASVKEVMETVNPVLDALNKFIKANAIDRMPGSEAQEVDDQALVEQLVEEMKSTLGRRQKIALATKRFTIPDQRK